MIKEEKDDIMSESMNDQRLLNRIRTRRLRDTSRDRDKDHHNQRGNYPENQRDRRNNSR